MKGVKIAVRSGAGLRKDAAFVMQSGSMVYGDTQAVTITEDQPFAPPPPLAGRAALEQDVLDAGVHGPHTFIVHAAFVYGDGAVPLTLRGAAWTHGVAGYLGEGLNRWSPVHVADWARLMVDALEKGPGGGQSFFAAAEPSFTMRELAAAVAASAGLDGPRSITFQQAMAQFGFFGPALAIDQRLSSAKARRVFGWQPQHVRTLHALIPA